MRAIKIIIAVLLSIGAYADFPTFPLAEPLTGRQYGFNVPMPHGRGYLVGLHDGQVERSMLTGTEWVMTRVYTDPSNLQRYQMFWVPLESWNRYTLGSSNVERERIETGAATETRPCPPAVVQGGLQRSLVPQARPWREPHDTGFWMGGFDSPYSLTTDMRDVFREQSYNQCVASLWQFGESLLSNSEWRGTTIPQRARMIHETSQRVFRETVTAADATGNNRAVDSRHANYVNPHYIDPMINPEVLSCISYQETRGGAGLNPMVYNHTYCERNQTSTAFGLGGITESTVSGMINHPDGRSLMPWLRTSSVPFRQMDNFEEVHQNLMYHPDFQIEAMIYIFNEKAKFIRRNNQSITDESELLDLAIGYFDQDGKSDYVSSVRACMTCLQQGTDANSCYEEHIND